MLEDFAWVGHDLYATGAVSSHGGNMSVRLDDHRILITRTGSMIGHLGPDDVVETTLADLGDPRDADCSVELVVHRAIYATTRARAIVHAHPVHTIARSLTSDVILPIDSESRLRLVDAPVIVAPETVGSAEAGAALAEALRARPVAVLRSHGPFAIGRSLEDAWQAISCLEASCAILDAVDASGRPLL